MSNKISNGVKKILYFITQSEFGGAQRYVFDLANNLKTDFQVAVALGEQANNGRLTEILTKNNVKYFILPRLKRSISPISDILALFEVIKLIKRYQPDIIHLNSSKISILGSLAAFFTKYKIPNTKYKIIYTVHGWVFNEPLPDWQKLFYLWAEKFTARLKNKIICVSEHDRQTALRHKIAPENKLITIHNGLAPIEFLPPAAARQMLFSKIQNTKYKIQNLLIGSIGNLYKTKGYEYFIRAADILINQYHLPATFVVIGEGQEKQKLETLIKKYSLRNNFILTGQIDNAARLLKAFDFYVCSSVKEGLPYSILEAMQAGLPIVSANVGGIPEMIEHKKTGLLAKPADPRALAESIKLLMDRETLRAELGARAKEKATTEFSLNKMIEATKNIYQ